MGGEVGAMNADDFDLRGQLGKVLAGELPLDAFRHWFASALWRAESEADEETLKFVYLVENHLAELSGGHISETRLLEVLRQAYAEWDDAGIFAAAAHR
jgi:hypothetical protein